jgi:hypothetical protein
MNLCQKCGGFLGFVLESGIKWPCLCDLPPLPPNRAAPGAQHTPGPWRLDDPIHGDLIEEGYHFIDAGNGFGDAQGFGFGISGCLSRADAALIASAPDLASENAALKAENARLRLALEACSDKLERVSASCRGDSGHSEHTLNVLAQARAALAARQGETTP